MEAIIIFRAHDCMAPGVGLRRIGTGELHSRTVNEPARLQEGEPPMSDQKRLSGMTVAVLVANGF